jgi:hypothetical protein
MRGARSVDSVGGRGRGTGDGRALEALAIWDGACTIDYTRSWSICGASVSMGSSAVEQQGDEQHANTPTRLSIYSRPLPYSESPPCSIRPRWLAGVQTPGGARRLTHSTRTNWHPGCGIALCHIQQHGAGSNGDGGFFPRSSLVHRCISPFLPPSSSSPRCCPSMPSMPSMPSVQQLPPAARGERCTVFPQAKA